MTKTTRSENKDKKPKRKKVKTVYLPDDGRTIYSMDGLNPNSGKEKQKIAATKEERRDMIKAAFAVYAPIFFGVLLCFGAVLVLLYFWLR